MSASNLSSLISVQQAIEILDSTPLEPRIAQVALWAADGLHLAEDLVADRDYPPFDKSLMDGYAVRSADVRQTPVELRVVGEILAGQQAPARRDLAAGETLAIMTGAPLPDGADGVVPVEDVQIVSESLIRVMQAPEPDRHILRQGSEIRGGAVVLGAGTRCGPAQLAVAATVGASTVKVFDRPRVAVLATGDELISIETAPSGSQIRNSNSSLLVSLLKRLGCEVHDLGIAKDDPEEIRAKLQRGLEHDALLVSGGMSMGTRDYVPRLLGEIGVDLKITKLRIKPGKPFIFGSRQGKFVFGLPGNPVAGFVCTLRLASRILNRLAGGSPEPRWVQSVLKTPLPPNGPREFYQPVIMDSGGVTALQWKGSADVFTLARADALLVRAENDPARRAGETVRVMEIPT